MNFFDKLEKTVTETGQGIGRKAKELAEITRLRNMLHTCEEVIDQNYREIGKRYVEAHKEDDQNEFAEQIKAVLDAKNGAEVLREQIARVGEENK